MRCRRPVSRTTRPPKLCPKAAVEAVASYHRRQVGTLGLDVVIGSLRPASRSTPALDHMYLTVAGQRRSKSEVIGRGEGTPPTITSPGPCPSERNAIVVPSLDVTELVRGDSSSTLLMAPAPAQMPDVDRRPTRRAGAGCGADRSRRARRCATRSMKRSSSSRPHRWTSPIPASVSCRCLWLPPPAVLSAVSSLLREDTDHLAFIGWLALASQRASSRWLPPVSRTASRSGTAGRRRPPRDGADRRRRDRGERSAGGVHS